MTVIGMISGTSMDGIDVAAGRFLLEGEEVLIEPLGATSVPYEKGLLDDLAAALPPAHVTVQHITRLDNAIGRAFAAVAGEVVADIAPDAELIVSHGQTLFHWVESGHVKGTLQIGEPSWIAEATGLPVVAGLRVADVAAGGHGAPLASLFDTLLLAGTERRSASVNLGGIANLTIVTPDSDPIAYDTGPANALIDAAVAHVTGGRETFDRDGAIGAAGTVDEALLGVLLEEPYYDMPHPKTTGKELFHLPYLREALDRVGEVSPDDLVTTVTALSAVTVADACRAHRVDEVIVAGGGVFNPTLLRMLREQLPEVHIRPIDELGIPAGAKESYFIALIGFLTVHGLPGNVPTATGAKRRVMLGSLLPGAGGFKIPAPVSVRPTRLRIVDRTR